MLNCKDATQLMSQSMENPLPFGKRISLVSHLMMCRYCLRAYKQFKFFRLATRHFDTKIDHFESKESLSASARKRIEENLAKET
jgi:hypothetical protein